MGTPSQGSRPWCKAGANSERGAMDIKYQCKECMWVGVEADMEADYIGGDEGESWSNWICPQCGTWWQLEDYEIVDSGQGEVQWIT